jgi:hypothetical protein
VNNRITGPQGEPLIFERADRDVKVKPLGVGYGPVGGQQFPEACALKIVAHGPQNEIIYEDAVVDDDADEAARPDSAVAAGTDRNNLMELFADDRACSPHSVELCEKGYRVHYSDSDGNVDSVELDEDDINALPDDTHERLRAVAGGSCLTARVPQVRSIRKLRPQSAVEMYGND